MGGITSGVGLFSGIDSASLIDQLISVQSRPLILAQSRVIQLNQQQAAYLDINTRLSNFKTAAASFRVNNIFETSSATSGNESILTATASSNAVPGSYNFIVDRLVSSQQLLTRGFADQDTSAIGLDSLTFERPAARIDSDTALADLNSGDGVNRGVLSVTTSSGTTEVDLSRAASVSDVLDAFNAVEGVTAYVDNDKFVLEGLTGIEEVSGTDVLSSLGLDGSISSETLTGTSVYSLTGTTSLGALNDGRGVEIRDATGESVYDFSIVIDGDTGNAVNVRIGEIQELVEDDEGDSSLETVEGAVSTLDGVIDRINDALSEAGYSEVTASINTSTGAIDIVDSLGRDFDISSYSSSARTYSTASDLGIEGSFTGGTANGERIFAGLNTRLVSSLNGGSGLDGTDGILNFTTRDGTSDFLVDVSGLSDVNDIVNAINSAGAGAVTVSVNAQGTGFKIVDNTTNNGGTFSISGTGGADAAEALGISGSGTSDTITGTNMQLAYISNSTLVSELNNGDGIGTGEFQITDSYGNIATIDITSSVKTVGDLIKEINGSNLQIEASINANGDGITISEVVDGTAGTQAIRIEDLDGRVAELLGIEGEAAGVDGNNYITGSEEKVLEFEPDATLEDIRNAINAANVGVSASIINTGSGSSPFRLSLASENSGEDGRFLIDTGGFNLGLSVLDEGNDARVFFGSSDPASGVLLTSSTNTLDGVVEGVSINLVSTSEESVQLSVARDVSAIESKINEFISAFNKVVEGIDFRTRYDDETEEKGILLGDSTMLNLRNSMFSVLRRPNEGFEDTFNSLTEVGITVGSGSVLEFDSEKFREAYNEDPSAVEALFTRRTLDDNDDGDPNTEDEISYSELSVLGQLEEFANSYVTSIGGVLQNRTSALDSQIQLQEDRIESIQASLERKRAQLQQQFLAMEQAIGSFQTQGAALSQIAALG
ncbi:MAG: flagellar filament capping protein FliD [Phycisphaerales bacterium]|nr:flagellar filament capping protein FliD [Phycisphaerales bacterium]